MLVQCIDPVSANARALQKQQVWSFIAPFPVKKPDRTVSAADKEL